MTESLKIALAFRNDQISTVKARMKFLTTIAKIVPGVSEPLSITLTILSNPTACASASVASLITGAPRTTNVTRSGEICSTRRRSKAISPALSARYKMDRAFGDSPTKLILFSEKRLYQGLVYSPAHIRMRRNHY